MFLIAATYHHLLDRPFGGVLMLQCLSFPILNNENHYIKNGWPNITINDIDIDLVAKVSERLNCSEIKEIIMATANMFSSITRAKG